MKLVDGKPVFSYEDTWDLDSTLAPIICEGFKKFKEVLLQRNADGKVYGVPVWAYEELGFKHDDRGAYTETEEEKAFEYYMETLDKIIYAFDLDQEPSLDDFGVDYSMDELENENFAIRVNDLDKHDRYKKAVLEWTEKCTEGRRIMVEKWYDWWW